MKSFWLKTLWFILGKLVHNDGLLQDLRELVTTAMRLDISGAEKRAAVLAELRDIGHDLAEIGSSLVNLALEIAVQLAKAKIDAQTSR
jgi:hypothetical protein